MDVVKFSRANVKSLFVFGTLLAKTFHTLMARTFLVEIRQFLELSLIVNTKVTLHLFLNKTSYTPLNKATIKLFS